MNAEFGKISLSIPLHFVKLRVMCEIKRNLYKFHKNNRKICGLFIHFVSPKYRDHPSKKMPQN